MSEIVSVSKTNQYATKMFGNEMMSIRKKTEMPIDWRSAKTTGDERRKTIQGQNENTSYKKKNTHCLQHALVE